MATYALTVSTNALGLGVISGATVVVERKRTTVTDIYPTSSLYIKKAATNASGIATIQLEADDGTVFHEVKIFNTTGVLIYKNTIQMPPQDADIDDLPLNDIISESAYQAVQAKEDTLILKNAAQTSATNAANSADNAAISETNASNSASEASTSATNANNSANAASTSATSAASSATNANNAQLAAESARDAALIQSGVYATESAGRAAVADGVAFKVQGSGDVAAYEYRRTDSTTSVLIATYPSKLAVDTITPKKTTFLQIGKNKFNKAAVTTGYYITSSGVIAANATYNITDYIPVVAGTQYVCNGSGIRFSCYFDANYNVVAGGTAANILTFTPPVGAAYIRASMYNADINTFQIEIGATATTYEVYQYTLSDAAGIPISASVADSGVTTAKLADSSITPKKTTFLQIGKNKFNKAAVTTGYYMTNTGSILANASYDISEYIPVVAGTAYVCNGSGIRFSCYFDANYNVVAGGTAANILTFTPPVGATYIRVSMWHSDLDLFQLEIGTTATAYEAYQYMLSDAAGIPISASVADSGVTSVKLADLAVTTAKLASAAVTPTKTSFLQIGKNKFNKAAVTTGYYMTNTGSILENATYDISDYIPVVEGTAYVCNGLGIRFSCYFDENYGVVAGGTASVTTFTPPTGATYIRVSMWHSDLDLFQLEIGTTATAYEAYQYMLSDAAGIPISASVADSGVTSVKLADLAVTTAKLASAAVTPTKTSFLQIGKNKFNKAAVTTGYYMTNTGSILANASYDISEYIPVVAGTVYANSGLLGYGLRYSCYFDANFAVVAGGATYNVATFTPPTGAAYVRVTTYHADLNTFQLEVGATATAYEEYQYTLSDSSGIPISASSTSSTTIAPILVMPPTIYGVQGRECNLYIDNLHVGESSLFNHDVTNTELNGAQQRERWTWTPTAAQTTGTLTVSAYDKTLETLLVSATTNQRAAASTAGSGTTKIINVIGDSLINAAVITQTVIDVAASDAMGVSFVGTRGTAPNKHEGRGGWKISDYATVGRTFYVFTVSGVVTSPAINSTVYTNNSSTFTVQEVAITAGSGTIICERAAGTNAPSASGTLTKSSGSGDATISFSASSTVSGNPFWISGALNYGQYLVNNSLATPDWVLIHLGINDAFSYTTDTTVIAAATAAFVNLDLLITSIKAAGAGVKVGLMIPTPPAGQDGFAASYGTGQTAWRNKRNIMLWAQELITKYTGQEASRIYLVPTNTALDVVNGYPLSASAPVNSRSSVTVQRQNNGVHPDTSGYQQIGDALWAFLKCNA